MRVHEKLRIGGLVGALLLGSWLGIYLVTRSIDYFQQQHAAQEQNARIQALIEQRRASLNQIDLEDPFGGDGIVRVLFLGLDTRTGEAVSHCDAIQFIEIDRLKSTVTITAVPRGTYAPLPGVGHAPTDYYISNACEIGGLAYGITHIETILGTKADYVVVIGFSGALGVFRLLDLPTTQTLQWLRARQAYAIGEPQRAHNHSTFLKNLLINHTPTPSSEPTPAWQYLLYQLIDTDLSFTQTQQIVESLTNMDIGHHPDDIVLRMTPAFEVTDIPYDPAQLEIFLTTVLDPLVKRIKDGSYSGRSHLESQQQLMQLVTQGLEDASFVSHAFEQSIWEQMDDEPTRESVHFTLLSSYLTAQSQPEMRAKLITDYILEMETLNQPYWSQQGRVLLILSAD
ncbi:MAG: hypothetical protein NUV84_03230 [Candidatus Uhrbacteria bacterium]|nr:hypothetical protein [Candidatus Uhrbacteria bacterium]